MAAMSQEEEQKRIKRRDEITNIMRLHDKDGVAPGSVMVHLVHVPEGENILLVPGQQYTSEEALINDHPDMPVGLFEQQLGGSIFAVIFSRTDDTGELVGETTLFAICPNTVDNEKVAAEEDPLMFCCKSYIDTLTKHDVSNNVRRRVCKLYRANPPLGSGYVKLQQIVTLYTNKENNVQRATCSERARFTFEMLPSTTKHSQRDAPMTNGEAIDAVIAYRLEQIKEIKEIKGETSGALRLPVWCNLTDARGITVSGAVFDINDQCHTCYEAYHETGRTRPSCKECLFRMCDVCDVKTCTILKCSRCKNAYYCSRKCQKTAWKRGHRSSCPMAGSH